MLSEVQQQLQRSILLQLYRATGGELWTRRDNWEDETKPVSSFHGVIVDAHSGAVIKVDLHYNGLSGNIPPELSNLTSLVELNLSRNSLS
eukprot:gene35315-45725_t